MTSCICDSFENSLPVKSKMADSLGTKVQINSRRKIRTGAATGGLKLQCSAIATFSSCKYTAAIRSSCAFYFLIALI